MMSRYSLSHLANDKLLQGLTALVKQDRATTADLLAHLAEVDERKLFLPVGYASMAAWCVGALGLSEDAAAKRIQVARLARCFPEIFPAIADGRLNVSAVAQLATYLTTETADELLAAAAHRTRREIELLLAKRFPRPAVADEVVPVEGAAPALELAGSAGEGAHADPSPAQVVGNPACQHAPGHVGMTRAAQAGRGKVTPLSGAAYALQCTLTVEAHELLTYAQALEGHAVAPGDLGTLLLRALRSHVVHLERRKFGKRSRLTAPKRGRRSTNAVSRHVPAQVRREVWQRDGGRCTFVGTNGHRCEATHRLEFDHAEAFARGGEATVANLRLRCRAHNQYQAEQTYGREFMQGKRAAARERAMLARARATTREAAPPAVPADASRSAPAAGAAPPPAAGSNPVPTPEPRPERESLVPWLRALGSRPAEARELAAIADAELPDGTLEDRIKVALKHSRCVGVKHVPVPIMASTTPSAAPA